LQRVPTRICSAPASPAFTVPWPYADIEANLRARFAGRAEIDFRQSDVEGELVGWVQEAGSAGAGVALNAGAYTHSATSIARERRGLLAPKRVVVELHLSIRRETFRHHSAIAAVCAGVICGFGRRPTISAEALLSAPMSCAGLKQHGPVRGSGVGGAAVVLNTVSSNTWGCRRRIRRSWMIRLRCG
jgi:3-dehydroquinate dehydratase-2